MHRYRCAYAVVGVGTGVLLLDGLDMAATKGAFGLPCALHARDLNVVRTYGMCIIMRNCYVNVANTCTAPKAKANAHVVGEKKSPQGLIIYGKQAKARELAPKVFLTKEGKSNRNFQRPYNNQNSPKQSANSQTQKLNI